MKKCPHCNTNITFSMIRTIFKCPACDIEVKSNDLLIFGIGLVFWFLVVGPSVAFCLSDHLILWILADLTIGALILYLMFLIFLKLEIKTGHGQQSSLK